MYLKQYNKQYNTFNVTIVGSCSPGNLAVETCQNKISSQSNRLETASSNNNYYSNFMQNSILNNHIFSFLNGNAMKN